MSEMQHAICDDEVSTPEYEQDPLTFDGPLPFDASSARPSGTLRAQDIRTALAMTILLLSSYVLNEYLFPSVSEIFPLGREISTYCGVGFSLVIAWAAYHHPAVFRERIWSYSCLFLFAVGIALLYAGLSTKNAALTTLGSPFGGMGYVWFSVLVGLALTRIGASKALYIIVTAFSVTYVLELGYSLFLPRMPLPAALVTYFLCIAVSYFLVRPSIRSALEIIRLGDAPTVLDATNPFSFLPFSSPVFVSIFLFNAAYGFVFASEGTALSLPAVVVSFLPVLIVFFAVVVLRLSLSVDTLYSVSVILVFAGFLFVPLKMLAPAPPLAEVGSTVLLSGGSDTFTVLMYFLIAAVGPKNPLGSLSTAASAIAASWLGIGVGALVAQGLVLLGGYNRDLSLVVLLLITFFFMTYNYLVMRKFSFETAIRGVHSVPKSMIPGHPSTDGTLLDSKPPTKATGDHPEEPDEGEFASLDRSCKQVAKDYALTQRELDVLGLLARGRTSTVIQEKLVLSHNTVKTHVRHIYTKLGIHSQQELIDLVEKTESPTQ